MRYLYFVIELENSLHNEFTIQEQSTTRYENPTDLSPYKVQIMLQLNERFKKEYIGSVMGEPLLSVWAVISGLCAPKENVRWMLNTIERVNQAEKAQLVGQLNDQLAAKLEAIVQDGAKANDPLLQQMGRTFEILETADKNFMRELRIALLGGIRVFEEFEGHTIALGHEQLLAAVKSIPDVLAAYYNTLFAQLQRIEGGADITSRTKLGR